jgi:hypothetical protein
VNRGGVGSDKAAAAEAANRSQGRYFLRVLNEHCVEIDRRIAKYQAEVTKYESRGSVDHACRCRRMIRSEERDRQQVDWMIDALHRRFTSAAPPRKRRPLRV